MRSSYRRSSRPERRSVSAGPVELVPLRERVKQLRNERALVEKAIAALTELSKRRYPERRPDTGRSSLFRVAWFGALPPPVKQDHSRGDGHIER